ncbi:MAG TPA: transglutaminase family protein [Puia sp.]|nr:transglutaminase family protein [Puia sp.]
MPKFKIHHITKYTYELPVRDSANQILLFPVKDEYQQVTKQELSITGEPGVDIYKDYYGNEVGSFMNAEPHLELVIDTKTEVITKTRPLPADDMPVDAQWNELQKIRTQFPYIDFLKHEKFNAFDEVSQIVQSPERKLHTPFHAAKQLNEFIYKNFKYNKGVTNVETTLDEIWKLKAGVCQDFAHLLLALLRIINIPARYVSGYICPHKNGMRGEGATHAWVEGYIPFYGWLGFDPTNNCVVDGVHVRLAVGRSFNDCSPVKGTYKGTSSHALEVGVSVAYEDGETIDEAPAILMPQPRKNNGAQENSYRKYLEMIQQQQ